MKLKQYVRKRTWPNIWLHWGGVAKIISKKNRFRGQDLNCGPSKHEEFLFFFFCLGNFSHTRGIICVDGGWEQGAKENISTVRWKT